MKDLAEVLRAHKLTDGEYENILKILKREPNLLEIGIFSAMWSEHCSYKSSKKYLDGFPTKAPWVIQGPGENAGVIDVGNGVAAVFKMESHNHPSFIDPYEGAATGVGGILRDVFTMGADPVAAMNSLRFGDIKGDDKVSKYQRHLVKESVKGIADYGNTMEVPTVGGEITFDSSYNGNILVNAFALGICKKEDIFYGRAEGIGNPVIYAGNKTGRDGLGAAVMASDSFSDEESSSKPQIQKGNPHVEKLLLKACLELFKTDFIVGIQDMGAAGLTSSSFEMAGRAGSGMKIYLDKVPAREEGMEPYDFMLSETQERMLICAKKGCEDKVLNIFKKYNLDAAVIGEVTDGGVMELYWFNELAGEIPVLPVSEEAPVLDRVIKKPSYLEKVNSVDLSDFEKIPNSEAFKRLIESEEVVDKATLYEQFDSMAKGNTLKASGSLGASAIKIGNSALVMGCECNPRFNYIDPKGGAAVAVMQSCRNVALAGAKPLAITDCLNYGNPENPEVMWQFAKGCEGIKEACLALNVPVVSGNVSLYNETDGESIFPTPAIAAVGTNKDSNKVLPSFFTKENSAIYLVGETKSEFGGTLYLKELYGEVAGSLPKIDYENELKLWDLIIKANENSLINCAKEVGVGGIAISLAKMSSKSNMGVNVNFACEDEREIFSESHSRALVEVEDEASFIELAQKIGIKIEKIGSTGGKKIVCNDLSIQLDEIKETYLNKFKQILDKE